jgi:hypothetical protein
MLKCVTRLPARRQGPTPFSEIQVSDLLDLQILAIIRSSRTRTYTTPRQLSCYFLFSHYFLPLLLDDASRMHNGIPPLETSNA